MRVLCASAYACIYYMASIKLYTELQLNSLCYFIHGQHWLHKQITRVYLVTYRPMEEVTNSLYKTDRILVDDYTAALWAVQHI